MVGSVFGDNFEVLKCIYKFIGFVIVFGFKNSSEMCESFEPNYKWLFFMIVIFFTSIVFMGAAPTLEFIYYEF